MCDPFLLPRRNLSYDSEEEDEEGAFVDSPDLSSLSAPILRVGAQLKNPDEIQLIVLGMRGAGALFLHSCFPQKACVGCLLLPEMDLVGNTLEPSEQDSSCYLYQLKDQPTTLLVPCQYSVPAERSVAWARPLLSMFPAASLLLMDTLQRVKYVGPATPLPALRYLQTDASQGAPQAHSTAITQAAGYLEAPNVLEGAAAAILSLCQVHGRHAMALVTIQDGEEPTLAVLSAFESTLSSVLPIQSKASASSCKSMVHDAALSALYL